MDLLLQPKMIIKRPLAQIAIVLILTIVFYIGFGVSAGLEQVLEGVARIGVGGAAAILALSLFNYGIRFWRWQFYLGKLGYALPPGVSLKYYLLGFAFTATPGKAGEAVRSIFLKRHDVSYGHSVAALFAERLTDLTAIALLSGAGLWLNADFYGYGLILLSLVTLALGLLQSTLAMQWFEQGLKKIAPRRESFFTRVFASFHSAKSLLGLRTFVMGIAFGLLAWGAEALGFALLLELLGVPSTLGIGVGIYAVAILVGAISFLPGGIGGTELVMGLLLVDIGASQSEAVAATMICRVATLWFAVGIGIVALFLTVRSGNRREMSRRC